MRRADMNASTRKHSIALASLFTLGIALDLVGCGNPNGSANNTGQVDTDPDNPVAPPAHEPLAFPPVVNYGLFDPQTEEELKAAVQEGSLAGNPIVNYGYMIAKVNPSFDPAKFVRYGLDVKSTITANGAKYYYLHKDSDLVETMKQVRQGMGGVMYIEPDIAHYTTADPVEFNWDKPDELVANQQQYGVLVTQTLKAWQTYGFGPNRVVVCDIDTGVSFNHEDLTNVVRHAYTWFGTDGVNLQAGIDPYLDPEPMDFRVSNPAAATGTDASGANFHGTHTAGTIAAEGGNGKGVAGMCWNVDMVHYKCFNNSGVSNACSVYGSLWHLVKWKRANYNHTIPVNMSLGGPAPSQFAADMVEMALENDVMVCASSSNDYSGFSTWPGSYTGVMRIGATTYADKRVDFSNWGSNMSVMAPGYDVYSCYGGNSSGYWFMNGTSMAAPHVTGLVGYMLTFAPDLKPDQIRTYVEQNCDPIEGQKGFSNLTGWGRINTYKTIGAVIADKNSGNPPPSNYVLSPVKITVEDKLHNPMSNVVVYLYNCNQSGTISNYAASTLTTYSYLDVRNDPDLEIDGEEGVARFNGLKPGYYKAVASPVIVDIGTGRPAPTAKSTPVFEIRRGVAVPPMTLTFDFDPLFIQTLPTSNTARQGGNTLIRVYNSLTGAFLFSVNDNTETYELAICKMPTVPGTYWIQILPNSTTTYGEYALWLSGVGPKPLLPAPGTYADPGPDGIQGGLTNSRTDNSQLIKIDDKLVYANMTATAGHYYRFIVE